MFIGEETETHSGERKLPKIIWLVSDSCKRCPGLLIPSPDSFHHTTASLASNFPLDFFLYLAHFLMKP